MSEEKYQPIRRSDDHDDDDDAGSNEEFTPASPESLFDDDDVVVFEQDDDDDLTDSRLNNGEEGMSFAWRKQNGSSKGDFQRISSTDDQESASDCADDQTQHASNVKHGGPLSISSSLDFDDDDDDMGLGRYNLDFTRGATDRLRTPTSTLEESLESGTIDFKVLWQVFLEAREDSRRRRLERLLNADSEIERISLCISSWCDLTDRGFILFLTATALFVIVCYFTENVLIIFCGVLLILVRIMWAPAYWLLRGRHLERKRKLTIELYDKMNSPDAAIGHHGNGKSPNGIDHGNGNQHDDNEFV